MATPGDVDAAVHSDHVPQNQVYEVFNPDYSVGVACERNGIVVGLHLDDEVWESTDSWLAAEIVRLARLAHMKARVGRRAELVQRYGNGSLADALGLPTEAQYRLAEKQEFGGSY
ncbi:hypothetical protein [Nocardia wallacei]|uniref:hypothetical protein n=1 Tax=Nocardia wallacei TaxID=480035 RepID=UPI00245737EB|nr:hypothetical protein [Nocardia wallacei]